MIVYFSIYFSSQEKVPMSPQSTCKNMYNIIMHGKNLTRGGDTQLDHLRISINMEKSFVVKFGGSLKRFNTHKDGLVSAIETHFKIKIGWEHL